MYEISKLEKQFSGIIKEFRNHPDDVMMEEGDVDQVFVSLT
jgi:hypothetical protein